MIPLRNFRRNFYKTLKQPGYALSVFFKRLRADVYYNLGSGKSAFPETITMFLTHSCNLRCKMCGQWGDRGATRKQESGYIHEEIPLDEIKKFCDTIAKFSPNITLFGGEPLIHSGCIEIIKHVKQKGLHCLMITNGSLLEKYAQGVVSAGLDELNVSLDGDAEAHDAIRGMPGLFNQIMSGLKEVRRWKKELKAARPLINLQCTISKYNYDKLERLLRVAGEAGACSLTFHNLIFLSRDLIKEQRHYDELLGCASGDWEGFVFDPGIDPELLYGKKKEIMSAKYPFTVDFYPNFSRKSLLEYYRNPSYMPSDYPNRCLSPWTIAYVFPDGEVRPCLNSTFSFGNIKKGPFMNIWNSEKAVKFRRLLKQKKFFPACVRCTELYRY